MNPILSYPNEIVIDIPRSLITIGGNQTVHFDNYIGNPKVSLIRVDANHIIFPGEAVAVKAPIIFNPDTELALEPRIENSFWFEPRIVENKVDGLKIVNESDMR